MEIARSVLTGDIFTFIETSNPNEYMPPYKLPLFQGVTRKNPLLHGGVLSENY